MRWNAKTLSLCLLAAMSVSACANVPGVKKQGAPQGANQNPSAAQPYQSLFQNWDGHDDLLPPDAGLRLEDR